MLCMLASLAGAASASMLASVAGAARAMHLWIFTRPLIWSTMSMRHLGLEAWNLDFMMRQVIHEAQQEEAAPA